MSETPLTVGVLGGMSSQSTVEYYRLLDDGINEALGGHHAADLAIRSVDFGQIERYIAEERWDEAGAFLADAARDVEAAGADFVVMATNTMHRVAPAIEDALSVPFVHIVDATAEAIGADGIDTVGVLGTAAVMNGDFYADRFADYGIDVITPDDEARTLVDDVIFEELTSGVIRDASREAYLRIIDDLVDAGADGVVLGCTEIELLVTQSDRPEVPLFDTTALHVERAVEYSLHGVR
ncbi:aspartate/glutamate racemase family protein [Halobaculum halobium]|uniref:Aspartate/glutamate racemase family protein n=1 Tax=Halobaculum halobium TaxID=3032281 RepID=A0ABD5T796_9EURY|nr:aspartate/glutamate racemase family protein [Halobaculum sp. SYNS20]